MYERAENRAANDRFWALIRAAYGGPAPATLTRDGDLWGQWRAPGLVLSQTCGLPYRTRLHGQVALVGTPHLDIDCPPGRYFSVLVARAGDARSKLEDFAGARFAYNGRDSQSGWFAPQEAAQLAGCAFGSVLETGSHDGSARAVAQDHADIAGIDAMSWALMRRWDPWTERLRVIAHTTPTPALPYITADPDRAADLFAAIGDAIDTMSAVDRDRLGLLGVLAVPADAYLAVGDPSDLPV